MWVDRAGTFRAEIFEYGLDEKDSGSVALSVKATLTEMWNQETGEWESWEQYSQEAMGDIYIIKKDKTPNVKAIESVVKCAGWDGRCQSIADKSWEPTPCQVSVKENTYEGNTRYRIEFINEFDRVPGGNVGNVDADKAKALDTQFGSSFRAIVGNLKKSKPAEGSRPAAPPPKAKKELADTPF